MTTNQERAFDDLCSLNDLDFWNTIAASLAVRSDEDFGKAGKEFKANGAGSVIARLRRRADEALRMSDWAESVILRDDLA